MNTGEKRNESDLFGSDPFGLRLALASMTLVAGCSAPLTHTALDLTPLGGILSAVGVLYWVLAAAALAFAVIKPPTVKGKIILSIGVLLVFGYLPVKVGWKIYQARSRLAKAEAIFQAHCKTAGVKIYRTAENVEGVLLMKIRPAQINYGHTKEQQFRMDDPYGRDSTGETYLKIFFTKFYRVPPNPPVGWVRRIGFHYVEAIDPKDEKRYRYTGSIKVVGQMDKNAPNIKRALEKNPNFNLNIYAFVLDKSPAPGAAPRYSVTYDDISTHEDREYWIAGSSLKVIDLQTNEVMAERIGYMMDRGQGSIGGGRSPWLLAARNSCPAFPQDSSGQAYQTDQTHDFVVKALKPKLEN